MTNRASACEDSIPAGVREQGAGVRGQGIGNKEQLRLSEFFGTKLSLAAYGRKERMAAGA